MFLEGLEMEHWFEMGYADNSALQKYSKPLLMWNIC